MASVSFAGTIRLWATETGGHLATMQGHDGRVVGVALDAVGHLAPSAGTGGTVRVWEARSGVRRRALRADRPYERLDISGLTGLTDGQHDALLIFGAVDRPTVST